MWKMRWFGVVATMPSQVSLHSPFLRYNEICVENRRLFGTVVIFDDKLLLNERGQGHITCILNFGAPVISLKSVLGTSDFEC